MDGIIKSVWPHLLVGILLAVRLHERLKVVMALKLSELAKACCNHMEKRTLATGACFHLRFYSNRYVQKVVNFCYLSLRKCFCYYN